MGSFLTKNTTNFALILKSVHKSEKKLFTLPNTNTTDTPLVTIASFLNQQLTLSFCGFLSLKSVGLF